MPSVLVVDDSSTILRIVAGMLAGLGYTHVESARDAMTALQILRSGRIQVTLCDWAMEPASGLQLLSWVRADPALSRVPFIVMTTQGQPDVGAAALRSGANAVLVKPFDAGTLKATLLAFGG
jgi:two-component system chemotaxis response regulator CheY